MANSRKNLQQNVDLVFKVADKNYKKTRKIARSNEDKIFVISVKK